MWLLMLIFFNGPMQIERTEILEMHWSQQKCISRTEEAKEIGLPPDSNIGCVYVGSIKNT